MVTKIEVEIGFIDTNSIVEFTARLNVQMFATCGAGLIKKETSWIAGLRMLVNVNPD